MTGHGQSRLKRVGLMLAADRRASGVYGARFLNSIVIIGKVLLDTFLPEGRGIRFGARPLARLVLSTGAAPLLAFGDKNW